MNGYFLNILRVIAVILITTIVTARPVFAGSFGTSQELDLELGYVGRANTNQDGQQHVDPVYGYNSGIKYVISPQITGDLLLRLGAEWERFSFDAPQTGAVTDTLQHINAIIGFDYQLAEQWLMRAEIQPGIYSDFRKTRWASVGAPIILGTAYLRNADLQWFFGLRIDPRSKYPVLPASGVCWQYNEALTLDFQLPNPRVEYNFNDKIQIYFGAGIKAGTYVVDDRFGYNHGIPLLNGATIDYTEVRLGPGFSWKVFPEMTLEAEAGDMLMRSWEFLDKGVNVNSRPAPYLQLNCHLRF